jgi:hypothetical protein
MEGHVKLDPLSVLCPVCYAAPGDLCVDPATRAPLSPTRNPLFTEDWTRLSHYARTLAAEAATTGDDR